MGEAATLLESHFREYFTYLPGKTEVSIDDMLRLIKELASYLEDDLKVIATTK